MLPTRKKPTTHPRQTLKKTIIHFWLALLLAGVSLVWLRPPAAYAAAPPVCYPNTPFTDLRLENSPLADQAYGDHRLDFDGDGKTDVFSTIPEEGLYLWRFSAGARQPWQNLGRSVVEPADLRFGDFNGDGKTDLFSIGPNSRWRYADGGVAGWVSFFRDPDQTPLAELRFGDFDGNGQTDVFRIGSNGRWQVSPGAAADWEDLNPLDMGTPLTELRFGDFDGDGKTDAFRRRSGKVGRWQVSPGAAVAWQDLGQSSNALTSLRFGDFNGDGQTDAFRRQADGRWQYASGAAGAWQDLTRSSVGLADLRLGDFNGDGVTDVLSQAPGGKWRVSLGGATAWRIIFATVEVNGGRLTCLTGAAEAGRNSYDPAISADGRKIVFYSDANFNNQGIPPGQFEIWLYDADRGGLTRLTHSGPKRDSRNPVISADGRKIVFRSDANFNNQDVPDNRSEIWLYDLDAQPGQELTRLTDSGPDRNSFDPAISTGGSKIVFRSDADFKSEGNIGVGQFEIWLYDVERSDLSRITTASGPNRGSRNPAISADGSKIVFQSSADFNNQDIPPGQSEIWLYDIPGGNLTRLTTASGPDRDSQIPTISADGSKIVFYSDADFNSEGIPADQNEIWLYNADAQPGQELTRLTTVSGPERGSFDPVISADGSNIAFNSNADFNNEGIPILQDEIWLYDVERSGLSRITTASGSGRDSFDPAISANGSNIAFQSDVDFLGLGIPANQHEIWLFETDQALPPPGGGGSSGAVYLPLVVK
jgi:Tol biopolymer transport system component